LRGATRALRAAQDLSSAPYNDPTMIGSEKDFARSLLK